MAAELVETSRLFARTVAKIQPEWIEPLAGHLVKRTYSEPHWSRKRAAAVAVERVTLHGVPIVVDRRVDYGRIDPETSRDLFIRHALVEGDWDTRHPFFRANRALLEDVEELETRARRRDLSVDEETLFAFYDARIPADVVSGRHFDTWWKKQRDKAVLDFTDEMVRTAQAAAIDPSAYPDHVEAGGLTLPLSYAFEPGRRDDGITVDVPVAALHQVDPTPFTWQVPGLREELVTALIKTLPKTLRRQFAPAPDHARAVLARLQRRRRAAARRAGARAGPDARRHDPARRLGARPAARAPHRHVPGGRRARPRRSPAAPTWRRCAASSPRRSRAELAATDVTQSGLTTWTIGELPREIGVRRGRHVVTGYPGLVDRGDSVDVRVFPTAAERDAAHARGVRRLLLLDTPSPARQVHRGPRQRHPPRARPQPARLGRRARRRLRHGRRRRADQRRGRARPGTSAATPGCKALFAKRLAGTTQQVLDAVRGVLTVWHRVQSALADLPARRRATSPPSSTPSSAPASPPATAPPGWPTWPATWRRPSGGSRSCASTRPATRRGRRRWPSSPTSTRSSWPPSRPAPSRRPRCARSAG